MPVFEVRPTLLVALLVLGCADRSDSSDAKGNETPPNAGRESASAISRSVQVNLGPLTLGEPLNPVVAAAGVRDTMVSLGKGAVGGAERVHVLLTPTGAVRSIIVDYPHTADFQAMVDERAATLGAPQRSNPTRQGEQPAELAVWRDARTELRMLRDPNRSAWTVRTELIDRASGGPAR